MTTPRLHLLILLLPLLPALLLLPQLPVLSLPFSPRPSPGNHHPQRSRRSHRHPRSSAQPVPLSALPSRPPSRGSCNCGHCADNGKHPEHRILILVLVSLLQCLKKLFYLYHNCHPFRSVLRPSLLTCSHSTLLSHSVQNDHFVTSISQSLRFYYKNFIRVTPLPSSALQRMQTFFSRRPGQN